MALRVAFRTTCQPLWMHQKRQFGFLILAFAKLGHRRMATMRTNNPPLGIDYRKRMLVGRNVERHIRSHPSGCFFDMKVAAAFTAGVFPMLHGERLHRHHWTGQDRRTMTTSCHLTRAMLGPEGVDDLWPFVLVLSTLLGCEREWIEVHPFYPTGRHMRPFAL